MLSISSKRCLNHEVIKSRIRLVAGTRNIFVVSTDRKKKAPNKAKDNQTHIKEFLSFEEERQFKKQEAEYKHKLEQLKTLTRNVSNMIRRKEEAQIREKALQDIPMASDVNNASEKVYGLLGTEEPKETSLPLINGGSDSLEKQHNKPTHLFVPSVDLPDSISERLGLSVKFLVSKNNQNWPVVLQQLKEAGGFNGIPPKDVRKFLYEIPKKHISDLIPLLELLLKEANIEKSSKIVNVFIESLCLGSSITDIRMQKIEEYCDYLRTINKKGKLGRESYELLIEAYGKSNNLEKVNKCLAEMKELKLEPSPKTFSNILQTCVYKARDHEQAVEIFDSMKFLSQKTKPNTEAYQSIIVSNVNNDNIERALDLYQEMITEGIPINQKIVVALARGCTSRPSLRFKAWDFIFEIYNNGWEPTLESYEYILYLSARDGDIALARALYSKLNQSQSITPRAFSFLLLAYSKSSLKSGNANNVPAVTLHENGKNFRRNILSDTTFTTEILQSGSSNSLPFLPVLDLTSKNEILAESSAIWAHTLLFNPNFINIDCTNTYLNIAAEMGKLSDFIDRYDSATYFDRTGLPNDRIIIEEPELPDVNEKGTKNTSLAQIKFDETTITKSPILNELQLRQNVAEKKIARTSLTYVIALKAAGKFKNYNFAKRIWSERGDFRKTNSFKNLTRSKKDKLDFEFASAMVSCLTRMNLLEDAVAILLSTEYQFRWTWKELNELYRSCVEIGNDKACRTIRGIAKRAQINYEGKIRRKDFKRYIMERGF